MFDPLESFINWVGSTLECDCATYVPDFEELPELFCRIERTGGQIDYPHDAPDFTASIYATTDEAAESAAYTLAIAAKLQPPKDTHINSVGVPSMYSYGRDESGKYYIWAVTIPLNIDLRG